MFKRLCIVSQVLLALGLSNQLAAVEIGQAAPDCALSALDGSRTYNLRQQLQGKVVYVDFWASWCQPCAKSFTFLNGLEHDFKNRGLAVVAINLDEEVAAAQAFLANHPADFSIALNNDGQCPLSFGVSGMPSSYLIDRKGVARHVQLGFKQAATGELRTLVEQLLKEK